VIEEIVHRRLAWLLSKIFVGSHLHHAHLVGDLAAIQQHSTALNHTSAGLYGAAGKHSMVVDR